MLSLPEVDGSQPVGQLSEELIAKAAGAGEINTSNKVLLSAQFSVPSTQQSTITTPQPSPAQASVEYHLQSEEASPLFDSLWAGAPGPSSRTAAVDTQAPLSKEVLYLRFGNVYSDIMTGLHRYSEQGAQRVPLGPLHVSTRTRFFCCMAHSKQHHDAFVTFCITIHICILKDDSPERRSKVQAQKKATTFAQPNFVKIQAQEVSNNVLAYMVHTYDTYERPVRVMWLVYLLFSCLYIFRCFAQRIKSLELEIASLEKERQMGRREIDAVDSDIRARKQEITNISRKYLNYFYYF